MAEAIENYKPGSVRRVKLKNFLTYHDVEFFPGSRLNIVVGANGTGKSSILCALCLGLGGNPNLLGRADDLKIFVAHNQVRAEIEVELVPEENETHVIRRSIDVEATGTGSTFFLNGTKVTQKHVRKLVKDTYKIQIDNLCTFLPQDKVGNFSGFTPKELLVETEKAISPHLYDNHLSLIEMQGKLKTDETDVVSIADKLKQLEEENEQLEREKKSMEEREKLILDIGKLKQKKAWLKFDESRIIAAQKKTDKENAKRNLKEAHAHLRPLREKSEAVKNQVSMVKNRAKELASEVKDQDRSFEKCMSKYDKFQDEIESCGQEVNSIDSLQRRAQKEVEKQSRKVDELNKQFEQYPAQDELNDARNKTQQELRAIKGRLDRAKKEMNAVNAKADELHSRSQTLERKLKKMQDDKAQRKARIFRTQPNLKNTFNFIDSNREMFRRPVHGPIVCTIDPKNVNAATFVEQHVPNTTLKSYVVECDEDYNLLYREVNEKRNMPINIIKVPQGRLESIKRMYSDEKMNMFKSDHGVLGYLDELIKCPDAVLQALINFSNLHSVLVGNEKTQESLDRHGLLDILSEKEDGSGKPQASCIFSMSRGKSYKYTSQVSRFSGKIFLRVDDVLPAKMLAPGIPQQQKDVLIEELDQIQSQKLELEPVAQAARETYQVIEAEGKDGHQKLNETKRILGDFKTLMLKVATAKRKLEDVNQEASKDYEAEKHSLIKKLKKHVQSSIQMLEAGGSSHDKLMTATYMLAGNKMTVDGLVACAQRMEERITEKESASKALEDVYNEISRAFVQARDNLRKLKNEADKIAPLKSADGTELPLKAELEALPESLDEVEIRLEEAVDKVESIQDNPEVLQAYEQRKLEIERTKKRLGGLEQEKNDKITELESILAPWEAALMNTVKKVNVLFSKYMKDLGCAGEIRLKTADDDNVNSEDGYGDFREWGVEILVKFREKSSLQVLSARVQSGGERSVSTIMYLMALQELMVAPFRCVDEINQGLDERNERLVFRRIVENSTKIPNNAHSLCDHSGQYFLITPKLLPNLTDMENEAVTLLFIFNGPYNFDHCSDWKVNDFLGKKRIRCDENEANKENNIVNEAAGQECKPHVRANKISRKKSS
eukprot:CAMPEP_0194357712 /NCGR_PEP_ID=MMETSP0174-20130528/5153_1 /TAXON_ID=216777 /ORGANISM="Proboscia alata, Strain PI-D3" /LENGTH=1120 /DNA_ID=CAMNT_0039127847 /DNA_START=129 /DNA_END=3491 /DNA_ORIENTATION=+